MTGTPIIAWRWMAVDGRVFHAVEARQGRAGGESRYETACGQTNGDGSVTVLEIDSTERCLRCLASIVRQWIGR